MNSEANTALTSEPSEPRLAWTTPELKKANVRDTESGAYGVGPEGVICQPS